MELTPTQFEEILRVKRLLPFRIAWGCIDKDTGEFTASATYDRRTPRALARKGHHVWILEPEKRP